jgi:hypothetical protein
MKTIRKNFILLAFAAGALFLIGNNVFGSDPTMPEPPPGDQGGGAGINYCMKPGYGGVIAGSYRCDDPGYPTDPPNKCGGIWWIRSGNGLARCF